MRWFNGALARLRLLFGRGSAEMRMDEEFHFHIEMETERLMRERGLARDEARRQALVSFGGVEKYREELREGRGAAWVSGMKLDLKLGLRMLVKYPGLTIVGTLALSIAIGAGASYLEFLNDFLRPRLPFDQGDRIVGIYSNGPTGQAQFPTVDEFSKWRANVESIVDLGAMRAQERNLITSDGRSEPVLGAEATASAMRVTRVEPMLGRVLTEADERDGATPVALIGYDLWQTRFGGDRAIVGRTIQLGVARYTVVGVMPERFMFPIIHNYWIPLRGDLPADVPGDEPRLRVIGRLADGADLGDAQRELAALDQKLAQSGTTGRRLRPEVDLYVKSIWFSLEDGKLQTRILNAINLVFIALLAVCAANIATLVFARTATRSAEITVRSALGASRRRIVAQLLTEAFVLAALAASVGLLLASFGARWIARTVERAQGEPVPFWWNDSLSPETFLYAGVLTIITTAFVGGIPALKATGARLQPGLRQAAVGGSSLKFGRVWTGVIISQVALTVVLLLIVVMVGWNVRIGRYGQPALSFPARNYVATLVEMDHTDGVATAANQSAYGDALTTLERRLITTASARAVTFGNHLPGTSIRGMFIEIEGRPRSREDGIWARNAMVAADYFDVFNAEIIEGRTFHRSDEQSGRQVAVVNERFVNQIMRGESPVGRRIRRVASIDPSESQDSSAWYTVVGVVKDLTNGGEPVLYRLSSPAEAYPVYLGMLMHSDAPSVERIRTIAASVDPRLRLKSVIPMSDLGNGNREALRFFSRVISIVGGVALLLSTAGVYSIMSFTVARRRREIAIRSALGAARPKLLRTIFTRAFWQLGLGILIGLVPGTLLLTAGAPEIATGGGATVGLGGSAAVAAFMMTVGLLACIAPAKRAMSVQPTEALKSEA